LGHNLSSFLKGFFETNDPVLKIKFWDCGQGIRRTLVDTNLAAFTKLPVPLHLFLLLIEGPARVRTADVTGKATRALFMIDHGANHPPIGGHKEFLLFHWSRGDRSKRDFSIPWNIDGPKYVLARHGFRDLLLDLGFCLLCLWV
jgi:hypothetical protein